VSPLPASGEGAPGVLWLDCYNANPQSTLASALTFWETGHRGPLLLGSLKELGAESPQLHKALGGDLARGHASRHPQDVRAGELVVCVGEEARLIGEGMTEAGYPSALIHSFEGEAGRRQCLEVILSALRASAQSSLFVKGSRSGRLEQIAQEVVEALSLERTSRGAEPRSSDTPRPKER